MDVLAWFTDRYTETVAPEDLRQPRARQLAALLRSNSYNGAHLGECRREPTSGHEILLLQVSVPLGQRTTINAVEPEEPVAVLVGRPELLPHVYPLRAGFPTRVPHFNVAQRDQPRSLCLYEAPSEDVRRTYTALGFIERVRWWFGETAYGRLHGDAQPLDPLFQRGGVSLILPRDEIQPDTLWAAARVCEQDNSPVQLVRVTPATAARFANLQGLYATAFVETGTIAHGRIQEIPFDLAQLLTAYRDSGVEIVGPLGAALLVLSRSSHARFLLDRPLILVVTTPLTRDGVAVETTTVKAFLIPETSAGDIAAALGVLIMANGMWGPPIGAAPPPGDLASIALIPADTYPCLDRAQAQLASGQVFTEPVPTVLLGAGALGSQLALIAARGGDGPWSIVDDDFLLPHNLARHGLRPEQLGQSKAIALADDLNRLLGDGTACGVHTNILHPNSGGRWLDLLDGVQRIIDTSASVPVARWLACDCQRTAPAVSCFLSPSGRDAVMLLEGAGQAPRLDHLEMTYYRQLVCDPALSGHLSSAEVALYVGGCRNPSVKIPQTRVAALACCLVEAVCRQDWPASGRIGIWRSADRLAGITYLALASEPFEQITVGDWTVWVRCGLLHEVSEARQRAGACETGGILVGSWDRDRRIAYIVSHYDPPPDSMHEPNGFVRGVVGVFETITKVHAKTAENLTYIGEWHTHPSGCGTQPSPLDEKLLWWVHDALQWSDAPALILIAGDDGFRIALQNTPTSYDEALLTTFQEVPQNSGT